MKAPWLAIIGLGEDGAEGLTDASRAALAAASVIFGGPRHLALVDVGERGREWPVPFDLAPLLALRGQPVAMLVSGDPFWHGAGGSVARHLSPEEWQVFPAPSCFTLAAARLGWRIEETTCIGLHAAPFARLRPGLAEGARIIATLRDGAAPAEFARWLCGLGFGDSDLWVMEALGGPREHIRKTAAQAFDMADISTPVVVAVRARGRAGLPRGFGLPDDLFAHDGQITKRPVRALTLSTLAPRPGEVLWDIGGGSGSVSVEWCLSGGMSCCIEPRADRAANIRANAAAFGVDHRLTVTTGRAPEALAGLPAPDAVFVGGGGDAGLFAHLWAVLPPGTRIVANAVTLESETLLAQLHATHGGHLMRIDIAQAGTLGRMRDWQAARPVVQWSVRR
ncbi:precorrin-6y C5,15-methyltransferase (decarboxylating) subunit CbiE [Aliigemmobacter aestuarii]|uniref:Precorrin-6y C5,15-methyltransferase (Decarboxylating) subunit CbiE n=1 Tax=Aliigemmobacter aestuarii TaxID=1445661 RepID=A0A4S3MV50_9RHOB|nr:precorrin-6y C5,15-methyltransferase (decarboxylating) subunit CbiE [Gemmobacter aestuarii]THD85835.1 precorrin-6y C5,15-methyltransferase (decarboxylating) subunit CbiE [Gemmobacter aestuarii]